MKRFLAGLLLLMSFTAAALDPFQFQPGGSVTISVTSSSTATALFGPAGEKRNVELQNAGAVAVFVEFCSSSTCTATAATSYPVLPGQSKMVTIQPNVTYVGAIAASGTQTLYVAVGIGE